MVPDDERGGPDDEHGGPDDEHGVQMTSTGVQVTSTGCQMTQLPFVQGLPFSTDLALAEKLLKGQVQPPVVRDEAISRK